MTHLSERFCLRVPLVGVVFVLPDGAQKEVNLSNGDLGQSVPSGAARAGAGTRAQR